MIGRKKRLKRVKFIIIFYKMNIQSDIYQVLITSREYAEIKKENEELKESNLMMIEEIRSLKIKLYELTSHSQDVNFPKKVKQLSIKALKIGQKFMLMQEQLFEKEETEKKLVQQSGPLYREAIHSNSNEESNYNLMKINDLQKEILKIRQKHEEKINGLTKQILQYKGQLREKQNNLYQLKNQMMNKESKWSENQLILKKQMQQKQQRQSREIKELLNQNISFKEKLNQEKLVIEQLTVENNKLFAINKQNQEEAMRKDKEIAYREQILVQRWEEIKEQEIYLKARESQVQRVSREQSKTMNQIFTKQTEMSAKESNLSQQDLLYQSKMSQLRILSNQLKQQKKQQQDYEDKLYSLKALDTLQQYEETNKNLKLRIKQLQESATLMMLKAEEKQEEASAALQALNNLSANNKLQEVIRNNFQSMIKLYKAKMQNYSFSEQKQRLNYKKEELKKGFDKIFQELMQKK